MAWIRLERNENPAGSFDGKEQYGGICEEADDLTNEVSDGYVSYGGGRKVLGAGSLALCAETGEISVKMSDGSWKAVSGGSGSGAEQGAAE